MKCFYIGICSGFICGLIGVIFGYYYYKTNCDPINLWIGYGADTITIQRLTGEIGKPPIIFEGVIDGDGHGGVITLD